MPDYKGKNKWAVNYLKTIYFDYPEWTHCAVNLLPAAWIKYRDELADVISRHPKLFPGFVKGNQDYDRIYNPTYELGIHVDSWGCVWKNIERGMESAVVEHPLADWDAMDGWQTPDPAKDGLFGPMDWEGIARSVQRQRERGDVVTCNPLPHGFMYMNLYYIRGFENLMLDMALDDPRLRKLIKIVEDYNVEVIRRCIEYNPDLMVFGEDLATQKALPMSPDMWRRYIKPSYKAIVGQCRDRGILVYLHSDGNIIEIIPDLIEVGVRIVNPQYRANGLDNLKRVAKGKVAINLDLDRQLFPFASKSQIQDHIKGAFDALYLPEGGLMMVAECAQDVPVETFDVICSTLEEVGRMPDHK